MTDDDLADVLALLRNSWSAPPKMPDGAPAAYRMFVGSLPLKVVMQGLAECAAREPKWRPSPAELLAACTSRTAPRYLGFDEAWPLIERAVRMIPGGTNDPDFPTRQQAAIDWLRTQDEAVAAWAARRGLRGPGSLGAEETAGEHSGATRHRLRLEHSDVIAMAQERAQLGGRPFVDRDFLARGGNSEGSMADLVERLRPAQQLEAGEAA